MKLTILIYVFLFTNTVLEALGYEGHSTIAIENTPLISVDFSNLTWHPTAKENKTVICEDGYSILVTVLDSVCVSNSNQPDYASISTGDKTLILAQSITNFPPYYFKTNILHLYFQGTSLSNLTVIFSRVGEKPVTTTTELTTSTVFVPTPAKNDSSEYVVYITGIDTYEFRKNDTLYSFKNMLLAMVSEYLRYSFIADENIVTLNNILIKSIVPCSRVNCNPCSSVRFAVPIDIGNSTYNMWSGYQLNTDHLQHMWENYEEKYLSNGIAACKEQALKGWILWQIVFIAGVTGCFLIILIASNHYLRIFIRKLGKRMSSSKRSIITWEQRNSGDGPLSPHYLQDTPPIFDSPYRMHTPAVGSENPVMEGIGVPDNEGILMHELELDNEGETSTI